jgi:flagellar motor protein MotB
MRMSLSALIISVMVSMTVRAEVPVDSSKMLALQEKDILVTSVYHYLQTVHEHQEDALKLKSDLEWLVVRMKRIEDRKGTVPGDLKKARQRIDEKLSLIDLDVPRLNGFIEKHLESLRRLDAQVKHANGNSAPDWWTFEDWIYGLMYPNTTKISRDDANVNATRNDMIDFSVGNVEDPTSTLRNELEQKIKAVELDNWVALSESGNMLTLDVQLPILFGLGKSDVAKDYHPFFKKLSWLLNSYSVKVDVVGYTDTPSGNGAIGPSDMTLGADRATHVAQELIETGMMPDAFKIIGQGEYKDDDLSSAMKRRVEVRVYFDQSKA